MGMGTVNVPGLIGRGGIPEAPTDGEKYLRQNGAWAALTETGDLASLTTDAKTDLVSAVNEIVSFSKVLREASGAGLHNSIYRGKYLGTSVTAAQWAAIQAGTFDDLWIGDYWVINGVTWRIADFDYLLGCGDAEFTRHHIMIVPDQVLYTANMNDNNTTAGGYLGSKMFTTNLEQAKTIINNAFGATHVLSHREIDNNAVTNGLPSGYAWHDSTVELMNEQMVYGGKIFGTVSNGTTVPRIYTVAKSQLSLFRYRPDMIVSNRLWYWLRDVVFSAAFANVYVNGNATFDPASFVGGVRPAFPIG